jgi:hypothetical protein
VIALRDFLQGVEAIVRTNPTYQLGQDGRNGACDCIGLIIGAYRRAGGKWAGTHGSNWAARNAMQNMVRNPLLEPGCIMYKAHEPGDAAYALPSSYQGHPDQRDYYHVGVVTSANPLHIAHCTSWSGGSGIKVDTKLGRWLYGGRLSGLDYEGGSDMEPIDTAVVYAANGAPVRMRKSPDVKSMAISKVPVGTEVSVLKRGDAWWQITYDSKTGWMMAEFLDGREQVPGPPAPADREALLLELEGLNKRQAAIIKALREVI